VPAGLDRLVVAATEKDRERRPPSASDLRASLLAVAEPNPSARSLGELVREVPDDVRVEEDRALTVTIPQRLSPKARRRRLLRRLAVSLMAVALVAGGALAAWAYVIPHYTHVPRVLGLIQSAASDRIVAAGLDAQFGPPVSSKVVPQGEVVRQSLAPGAKVRKGADVVLRISSGLPLVGVPTVSGLSLHEAERQLQAQGLHIKFRHDYSDSVRKGLIIDQNPLAGQQILFGSEVTVTVSDGRQPVDVPNVVGQSSADAQSVLVAQKFKVKEAKEFSADVPVGEVIRQAPKAGSTVALGSTVRLVISLGPKTFPMPSVVGLPAADAQAQLQGQGLNVHVVHIPGSTGSTVVGQLPDPGATVEQGETVSIFVA
jgi:serine/threonine-protein kinase